MKPKTKYILTVIFLGAVIFRIVSLYHNTLGADGIVFLAAAGLWMTYLVQRDMDLLGSRMTKKYEAANCAALILIMVNILIIYGVGCVYSRITRILPLTNAALCVCVTADLPLWWENMRKTLFMNLVVNPFEVDFLRDFGLKNEILKYFGVLREAEKPRHIKWCAFMVILPILFIGTILCALLSTFEMFLPSGNPVMMWKITQFYVCVTFLFLWIFSIHSTKKFYKKK